MNDEYISRIKSFHVIEGSVVDEQAKFMKKFIQDHNIKNIMEIGFNAGISSSVMLSVDDTRVVSFDIGVHSYVQDAKKIIDEMFPHRHTLILGDSTVTVQEYTCETMFDMIFVDGGHDGDVPELDIRNSYKLLKDDGFMIVDDYEYVKNSVKKCKDIIDVFESQYNTRDRSWIVLKKKMQ